MKEWQDVPGYEGLYQVNWRDNEVKSLDYRCTGKENMLNCYVGKYGHLMMCLRKKGVKKTLYLHQLVMLIKEGPCPEGLEVCHNDGNPQNNNPDNLRYDTRMNNMQDKVRMGRAKMDDFIGTKHKYCKKVGQFDLSGNLIREWGYEKEITKVLGFSLSGISKCCNGKQKTGYGFIWKFL